MTQITVLSGVERRRHWSDERKLALVEAAIVPGASVAAIARAADISPSSIYRWRRLCCKTDVWDSPRESRGIDGRDAQTCHTSISHDELAGV